MSKAREETSNAGLIARHEGLFRCPLCSGQMKLIDLKSLICNNRHCFDLSRQGYVNMLSQARQSKYDRQMFQSRRIIYKGGFFEPLIKRIGERIMSEPKPRGELIKMLDAGCGEGYLLSEIREKVTEGTGADPLGVGLDNSKEGIYLASREYPGNIWCVGDLARAPFAGEQFHFILNILAPANYDEFRRLIAPGGRVIKVIPARDYLRELREVFYEGTDKQIYSKDSTLELFRNNFKLLAVEQLRYSSALEHTCLEHLIRMTPLSWGTTETRLLKALEMNLKEITIDLTILSGKKN